MRIKAAVLGEAIWHQSEFKSSSLEVVGALKCAPDSRIRVSKPKSEIAYFDNVSTLIETVNPDVVAYSKQSDASIDDLSVCLKSGIPVIAFRISDFTFDELRLLADASRSNNTHLIFLPQRSEAIFMLRNLFQSERYGNVQHVSFLSSEMRQSLKESLFRSRFAVSGGLDNFQNHLIQLCWALDLKPTTVSALETEKAISYLISCEENCHMTLSIVRDTPNTTRHLVVNLERAKFIYQADYPFGSNDITIVDDLLGSCKVTSMRVDENRWDSVANKIAKKEEPDFSIESVLTVLAVTEAVEASAAQGGVPIQVQKV